VYKKVAELMNDSSPMRLSFKKTFLEQKKTGMRDALLKQAKGHRSDTIPHSPDSTGSPSPVRTGISISIAAALAKHLPELAETARLRKIWKSETISNEHIRRGCARRCLFSVEPAIKQTGPLAKLVFQAFPKNQFWITS